MINQLITSQNPKTPEMYELRCSNKDSKETWIQSITVAIEHVMLLRKVIITCYSSAKLFFNFSVNYEIGLFTYLGFSLILES